MCAQFVCITKFLTNLDTKAKKMVYLCQKDSYLKEFSTTVKACKKSNRSIDPKTKNEKVDGLALDVTDLF